MNSTSHQSNTAAVFGAQTPGSNLGNDLAQSFSWSFSRLIKNASALLLPSLIWGILIIVVLGGGIFLMAAVRGGADMARSPAGQYVNDSSGTMLAFGVFVGAVLLAIVAGVLWTTGIYNAAGMLARGERPGVTDGLMSPRLIPVAIVTGVVMFVASWLPIVNFVALFFIGYTLPAAAVDRLGLMDALKASKRAAMAKPGHTLVLMLVMGATYLVLTATVVGLLVALPLNALVWTSMYLRVTQRSPQALASM